MTRVSAENGRAATLIVLVGCCAMAGRATADTPVATALENADTRTTTSVEAPVAVEASPLARDHLLELVVEYLEVAFARNAQDARIAQLEPQPVEVVQ